MTQYDASLAMILRKPREITLQITDSLLERFKDCYHITDAKEKKEGLQKAVLPPPPKDTDDDTISADVKRPLRSSTALQRAEQKAAKRDDAATSSTQKSQRKRKIGKGKKKSSRVSTPKPSTSTARRSTIP